MRVARIIDVHWVSTGLMTLELKRDLASAGEKTLAQAITNLHDRLVDDLAKNLDTNSVPRDYAGGMITKHRPVPGLSMRGNAVRRLICVSPTEFMSIRFPGMKRRHRLEEECRVAMNLTG